MYAVGDIHGRVDVLQLLLKTIEEDAKVSAPKQRPILIFLGDYVDRGPASAEVVDLIITLAKQLRFEVRVLKGNHEEALLNFIDNPDFGSTWGDFGGMATLLSYGVTPPLGQSTPEAWAAAAQALTQSMPMEHKVFYDALELMVVVGGYAFVHAGVRPGVPLAQQSPHDLMWIRQEFLAASRPSEKIIVHGHTPTPEPQMTGGRIGIDTGVYATGVLTAVRIDDDGASFLQAKVDYAAESQSRAEQAA